MFVVIHDFFVQSECVILGRCHDHEYYKYFGWKSLDYNTRFMGQT